MLCMRVLQRGHGGDGCDLALSLYDLRKCDLFVLGWERVRRVRWGSISSELLLCGVGLRSILLLPRHNRYMYRAHVCFCVCYSDCGRVSVGMFVV